MEKQAFAWCHRCHAQRVYDVFEGDKGVCPGCGILLELHFTSPAMMETEPEKGTVGNGDRGEGDGGSAKTETGDPGSENILGTGDRPDSPGEGERRVGSGDEDHESSEPNDGERSDLP